MRRARKTLIHVGLQKTASTFFQQQFFPRLTGVCTVTRPFTQDNAAFNRMQFADDSLFDRAALFAVAREIEQGCPLGDTLLLSDELFAGFAFHNFANRARIARRLAEVFPDAEVILFLRGQVDLALSLYNQYLKLGWIDIPPDHRFLHPPGPGTTVAEWYAGNREWRPAERPWNSRAVMGPEALLHGPLVDLYEKHFSRVHVFLHEEFISDRSAVLRRFADLLGAGLAGGSEATGMVNPGVPAEDLGRALAASQLRRVFPRSRGVGFRLAARILAPARAAAAASGREHFAQVLRSAGAVDDNTRLNERFSLGMERFPKAYLELT